jgi:hypothetical protein
LAKNAWDAWDDVLPGEAEAGCPSARPDADAEKLAGRALDVLGPDVVRSLKPLVAAAADEREPYTRAVARSGERSCAELAAADAPGALVLPVCWPEVPPARKAALAPLLELPEQWLLAILRPLPEARSLAKRDAERRAAPMA